jgi:hypothetical protein
LAHPNGKIATKIRDAAGDEGLALLWVDALNDLTYVDPVGGYADRWIDEGVGLMLKPEKVHAVGCLHSGRPEVIVCQEAGGNFGGVGDGGDEKEDTSGLATDLYFKRCDGIYKNLAGRVLNNRHTRYIKREVFEHYSSSHLFIQVGHHT